MKTYLKQEKGITIMILILTIIILLILAGVGISAIAPGGMLEKVQDMEESIPLQQAIEEIHNEYDYKYFESSGGKELVDAEIEVINNVGESEKKNAVEEVARIAVETEISADKFTIYYDKKSNLDMIFYRADLVTSEEENKINNYDEVTGMFMGDANLDGVLSEDDITKLNEITRNAEYDDVEKKDIILKLCDVVTSEETSESSEIKINGKDVAKINAVFKGTLSILELYKGGE